MQPKSSHYQILSKLIKMAKQHINRNYSPAVSTSTSSVLMRYYSNQHQAKQLLAFSCIPDQSCFWGCLQNHHYQTSTLFTLPYTDLPHLTLCHSSCKGYTATSLPCEPELPFVPPFLKGSTEGTCFRVACCCINLCPLLEVGPICCGLS